MPKLTAATRGVSVISATPFTPAGAIDDASTDRLVDFYIECGADGLTILGIMGEAPKLEPAEALGFARRVIGRAGGRPVIVGVSSPGYAAMRSLALGVMELGAAGVMIAPPSTCRTDDQIVGYYAGAIDAIGPDVPFVIQDYPQASGVVMSVGVIQRIIAAHSSCVMLKAEDWPGLDKITAIRRAEAEGRQRRVSILCGNGGLFLDLELGRGADGAMTGYAFPELLVRLCDLVAAGQRDQAQDLFDAHLPLIRYEQQPGVGLAVRKYNLMKRGILASDAQRKPASALSAEARSEIDRLVARVLARDPGIIRRGKFG